MRNLRIYLTVASLACLLATLTFLSLSLKSIASEYEPFEAVHIENNAGNKSEQQTSASERISIKEHKAYKHVFALLKGITKYKGKTKKNTFYIAPVADSGKDSSSGNTYIYWVEDKSIIFVDLASIPMTNKFEDYVTEEIYEKNRRDLRTDVVKTEEKVISRYFISKAQAKSSVEDCLKNGEKILIYKRSH